MFGAHFVASLTHRVVSVFLAVFTLSCLRLQGYSSINFKYLWALKSWKTFSPKVSSGLMLCFFRHIAQGAAEWERVKAEVSTELKLQKKNNQLWSHPSFQEWRRAGLRNLIIRIIRTLWSLSLWYIFDHLQILIVNFKNRRKNTATVFRQRTKGSFSTKPGFVSYECAYMDPPYHFHS